MQAIALHPRRNQVIGHLLGLAALALLSLLSPALCAPVALAMPLLMCPVIGLRLGWIAYPLAVAPALIAALGGFDPLFSLSLVLPCGLCAAVTAYQRAKKTSVSRTAWLLYTAAYALALSVMVLLGARALGGDLAQGLSDRLTGGLRSASGTTLYQMAATGLAQVPNAYRKAGILSFSLDPALRAQVVQSLGLTLRIAVRALIPRLFVEVAMLGGLFASLRVQKLNHSFLLVPVREGQPPDTQNAALARPCGFRALELPPGGTWLMLCLALGSLCLSLSAVPTLQILGALCGASFECMYRLVGSAVIVSLLAARKPELCTVYGGLAALLYLLFPAVPLIVGLIDQLLHFRNRTTKHQEEE